MLTLTAIALSLMLGLAVQVIVQRDIARKPRRHEHSAPYCFNDPREP
jgi:hypothetical protein